LSGVVFETAHINDFWIGLTKFGENGKSNLNFRTVPKALILLFVMTCGYVDQRV
jgi:hypothetical protein